MVINLRIEGGPEFEVGNDIRVRVPVEGDEAVTDIYVIVNGDGIVVDMAENGVVMASRAEDWGALLDTLDNYPV